MKSKFIIGLFAMSMTLTSCYTSHFTVGDGPIKDKGAQKTYDKAKQMWLFWGLISINEGQTATPSDGNYMIKTKTKFIDGIVTGLTAGIFTMRTVKVKVKQD
jgi:hypothetical protein